MNKIYFIFTFLLLTSIAFSQDYAEYNTISQDAIYLFDNQNNGSYPEMVYIKGGTFQMGSKVGYRNEKPVHSVTVSDFYMGKYEVTVAEFEAFVNATGYSTQDEKDGKGYIYDGS